MRWGTKAVGVLLALSGFLALLAPVAGAAAPLNDGFASREDLGSVLPVEVERTNREATREEGEPELGSGHSIWFKWQAPATELVTIDTCKGGIGLRAEVGVFTGSALGALTKVAGGFDEGEGDCPGNGWGTTATFRAVAGVEYAIGVDAVASFSGPEAGQGFIHLALAATAPPVNDDFATATPLVGQVFENGIYAASASGSTWAATVEPGEPSHAGDPGGASVWYSWTAPTTEAYNLYVCGRFPVLFAVYTGDSLSALTGFASQGECGIRTLYMSAGTTYRIAIDGRRDPGSGLAAMGSFWLNLHRPPPAPAVPTVSSFKEVEPRFQRKPIDTILRKRSVNSERRRATFVFAANREEARFRCQLDRRMPTWCKSPKTYEHLNVGRHTFKVYAVDATSSGDGTPPVAEFRIASCRLARLDRC